MRKLALSLVVVLAVGCSSTKVLESKTYRLNKVVDDYFENYLKLYPLFATSIGDHRFDDQLTIPLTASHRAATNALVKESLTQVKLLGCNGLDHQDTLTCQTFIADLEAS